MKGAYCVMMECYHTKAKDGCTSFYKYRDKWKSCFRDEPLKSTSCVCSCHFVKTDPKSRKKILENPVILKKDNCGQVLPPREMSGHQPVDEKEIDDRFISLPVTSKSLGITPRPEGQVSLSPYPEQGIKPTPEGQGQASLSPYPEQGITPTPKGQGQVSLSPYPEQGITPTPKGQGHVSLSPYPEQGITPTPKGQGQVSLSPYPEQGITPTPKGQGQVSLSPYPEQGITPTPKGQGQVSLLPYPEQGITPTPKGQGQVSLSPYPEQGITPTPKGQGQVSLSPYPEQGIKPTPEGQVSLPSCASLSDDTVFPVRILDFSVLLPDADLSQLYLDGPMNSLKDVVEAPPVITNVQSSPSANQSIPTHPEDEPLPVLPPKAMDFLAKLETTEEYAGDFAKIKDSLGATFPEPMEVADDNDGSSVSKPSPMATQPLATMVDMKMGMTYAAETVQGQNVTFLKGTQNPDYPKDALRDKKPLQTQVMDPGTETKTGISNMVFCSDKPNPDFLLGVKTDSMNLNGSSARISETKKRKLSESFTEQEESKLKAIQRNPTKRGRVIQPDVSYNASVLGRNKAGERNNKDKDKQHNKPKEPDDKVENWTQLPNIPEENSNTGDICISGNLPIFLKLGLPDTL